MCHSKYRVINQSINQCLGGARWRPIETFHSVSTAGHTNHRAPAATGKAQGKAGGMERTELRAHKFKVATVPKTGTGMRVPMWSSFVATADILLLLLLLGVSK